METTETLEIGPKLFLFISSACHKKMLLESLNIPLIELFSDLCIICIVLKVRKFNRNIKLIRSHSETRDQRIIAKFVCPRYDPYCVVEQLWIVSVVQSGSMSIAWQKVWMKLPCDRMKVVNLCGLYTAWCCYLHIQGN